VSGRDIGVLHIRYFADQGDTEIQRRLSVSVVRVCAAGMARSQKIWSLIIPRGFGGSNMNDVLSSCSYKE